MTAAWKLAGIAVIVASVLGLAVVPATAKVIDLGGETEAPTPDTKEDTEKEPAPEPVGSKAIDLQPLELDLSADDILSNIKGEQDILKQRNQYLTDHFLKSGIALYDQLDYDGAKIDLEKSLRYDPNNRTAKEYLRKTETILGLKEARYQRILEEVKTRTVVERELAREEMKVAFARAQEEMSNEDYASAVDRFERVRELVKWIAPYFNEDDLEPYRSQTEQMIVAARAAQVEKTKREEANKRQDAIEAAHMQADYLRERQETRIEMLLKKGRDLLAEERYAEAQSLGERIMELDPGNREALELRDIAFNAGLALARNTNSKKSTEETLLTWEATKHASIPHTSILIYPGNWAEIIKRQIQTIGPDAEDRPAWMDELEMKLEDKVSFDFVETPLRDVVTFLQTITSANIILDDTVMPDNSEVTLKVTEMPLSQALDWILDLVGMKYGLMNQAIYISSEEKVGGEAVLKLYDVTDVILEIRDFPGNLALLRDRIGTQSGASTDVGAGGGGLFDLNPTDDAAGGFTGESLVTFIKQTIAPNSWDMNP